MRFEYGDNIDKLHVKVIVHEFFRCTMAFNSFINLGPKNKQEFENTDKMICLLRYNAYAVFVQHLYEYIIACIKRDRLNTGNIRHGETDKLINIEVEKILSNWRLEIDKGFAPKWANHRSYYEAPCPSDFGENFRAMRNSLSHADFRRIDGIEERITLTKFYKKYHKFVMLLFDNGREWWSIDKLEEIELGDVTDFNRSIHQS